MLGTLISLASPRLSSSKLDSALGSHKDSTSSVTALLLLSLLKKLDKLRDRFFVLTIIDFLGIHIMILQAIHRHDFVLGTFFAVIAIRVDADTTTWHKLTPHLNVLGL